MTEAREMTRAKSFVQLYLQTLVSAIYVLLGGFGRPRNRQAMRTLTGQVGLFGARPKLPAIAVAELVPSAWTYRVTALERGEANVTLFELCIISALVEISQPRAILEVGTLDGRTTINLAQNLPPDGHVFTLDLPEGPVFGSGQLGAWFSNSALKEKITQLLGNSTTYDFSDLAGKMDLVFVDGSHEYEDVVVDSRNALACLRDGRGIVLWHDYGAFTGPTRALDELWAEGGKFAGLKVIAGTTLAVLDLRA